MPWNAHASSLVSAVIAVAFVVAIAIVLGGGWFPALFAVVIGLPIFFGSRRWARRHFR